MKSLNEFLDEEKLEKLLEFTAEDFDSANNLRKNGKKLSLSILKSIMPRVSKTAKAAEKRIKTFDGQDVNVHVKYGFFVVKDIVYYVNYEQYSIRRAIEEIDVSKIAISKQGGTDDSDDDVYLGVGYVNTEVFLDFLQDNEIDKDELARLQPDNKHLHY
jgi:hypothetical protein|tara:strand:+ start:65 stop:541 length:477 start_codon:yes stop_codon:yes gene_type:complete